MSIRLMNQAWGNMEVSGSELILLLALCDHANDDGVCWPSVKRLAEKVRVQKRSVSKLLEKLESKGLLSKLEVGGGKSTSVYKVSPMGAGDVPQDTPLLYKEPPNRTTKRKTSMKEDWMPNNPDYAAENGLDPAEAIEYFKNWALGSDKKYANWEYTFRNACRKPSGWLHGKGIPAPKKETGFNEKEFRAWLKEKGWEGKAKDLDVYREIYKEEKGK